MDPNLLAIISNRFRETASDCWSEFVNFPETVVQMIVAISQMED